MYVCMHVCMYVIDICVVFKHTVWFFCFNENRALRCFVTNTSVETTWGHLSNFERFVALGAQATMERTRTFPTSAAGAWSL